jgi:hypothetical protein
VVQNGSKIEFQGAGGSGRLVTVTAGDMVGSKIVVGGTAAESKSGNQCMAKTIEITLATPLTGKKTASSEAKKTAAEK